MPSGRCRAPPSPLLRPRSSPARAGATRACVPMRPPHPPAHPSACLCSAWEMLSTVTEVKGVASPSLPANAATCGGVNARGRGRQTSARVSPGTHSEHPACAHKQASPGQGPRAVHPRHHSHHHHPPSRTLLISASTKCPMVMREGMACGLMMRSGETPSAVKGISSCECGGREGGRVGGGETRGMGGCCKRALACGMQRSSSSRAQGDAAARPPNTNTDGTRARACLGVGDADGALLPVPRSKLVAHLRDAHRAHTHLDESLAVRAGGEQHTVHHPALRVSQ